jgi:hypothetical protein
MQHANQPALPFDEPHQDVESAVPDLQRSPSATTSRLPGKSL